MEIIVNGEKIEVPQHSNIEDLVVFLGYQNQRFAIEINELIIPKSDHSSYLLNHQDKVEIINAVGGG